MLLVLLVSFPIWGQLGNRVPLLLVAQLTRDTKTVALPTEKKKTRLLTLQLTAHSVCSGRFPGDAIVIPMSTFSEGL